MRQAEEQQITGLKFTQSNKFQARCTSQVGVRVVDELAGKAFRGDLLDRALWME